MNARGATAWTIGLAGWLAAAAAAAQGAAAPVPNPSSTNHPRAALEELARLDPALAKELEKLKIRRWDLSVNASVGAGYKDNLLLSRDHPEASPFIRLGLETTVLRLPENGWSFSGLAAWEDYRYTRAASVDKEQTGMALVEWKKAFTPDTDVALRGQYLYLDQVLDLAAEQGLVLPLAVRLHALQPRMAVHHNLGRRFYAETELGASRHEYQAPVDDFWEMGPLFRLGLRQGRQSDLSLAYEYNHRWYDSRRRADLQGAPLDGPRLEYAQHRASLSWRHFLDEARRWRITLRLRGERSLDNGSDYYGFWKYGVQPQVRYQHPRWSAQAGMRWMAYDYPRQRAAPGGEKYQRAELQFSLRGDFKLNRDTRLQWEYQWERNFSNLAFTEYTAHTVWAGVAWEF